MDRTKQRLDQFESFLTSINLRGYRAKYSHIKLVELDLPREIQPLKHIYDFYWQRKQDFFRYEDFYEKYCCFLQRPLEKFRKKAEFSEDTFYRGLPARMYRTWASLLTQIQAGYLLETLYGEGSVTMAAELDWKGIDIQLRYKEKFCFIQIKKESLSREVRAPRPITKRKQRITEVIYEVPGCEPQTPTGRESRPFQRWKKKWEKKLKRLDNGFIVFLPDMFKAKEIFI